MAKDWDEVDEVVTIMDDTDDVASLPSSPLQKV
jgi:hypothetical protein